MKSYPVIIKMLAFAAILLVIFSLAILAILRIPDRSSIPFLKQISSIPGLSGILKEDEVGLTIVNEDPFYNYEKNPLFDFSNVSKNYSFIKNGNISEIIVTFTDVPQKSKMFWRTQEGVSAIIQSYNGFIANDKVFITLQNNSDLYAGNNYENKIIAGETEVLFYRALTELDLNQQDPTDSVEKTEKINRESFEFFNANLSRTNNLLFLITEKNNNENL